MGFKRTILENVGSYMLFHFLIQSQFPPFQRHEFITFFISNFCVNYVKIFKKKKCILFRTQMLNINISIYILFIFVSNYLQINLFICITEIVFVF